MTISSKWQLFISVNAFIIENHVSRFERHSVDSVIQLTKLINPSSLCGHEVASLSVQVPRNVSPLPLGTHKPVLALWRFVNVLSHRWLTTRTHRRGTRDLDYKGKPIIKSLSVYKRFLTWLLIGWQFRSHVWKFLSENTDFNKTIRCQIWIFLSTGMDINMEIS